MFFTIFSFEIRQQFKKPFTWVFLGLMFAQGMYYMHHSGEFFSADQTYANAPAIIYTVLAGMGYVSFILTALLGGQALSKDLENRTAALLYTTNADEGSFFWGRFWGAALVLLLLNVAYLLGILAYNFLPIPNLGPFSFTALLKGVVLILIPNTLVLYIFSFAAALFSRNARTAYLVVLFSMLLMIFGVSVHDMGIKSVFSLMLDPTVFAVLMSELAHLSPAEKNAFEPDFAGYLLYNRLIWCGLAIIVLILARKRYSFKQFSMQRVKPGKTISMDVTEPIKTVPAPGASSVLLQFSLWSNIKKMWALTWLDFKSVTRPAGFRVFLALLLIIYIFYIAVWQQQYYSSAPTLPVTLEITNVTIPLSFYFLMFIVIYTGELMFKDQVTGFSSIADALPLPSWVTVLSKVTAMILVGLCLSTCLLLFGVMVQVIKGYYHFEPEIYISAIFTRWTPKYIGYILLTAFVAGVSANRYVTHAVVIVTLVISVVFHEIEVIEQNRLNFLFSPGTGMNTDMNGNGIFSVAHNSYMVYWLSLCVALLAIGVLAWQRGLPKPIFKRLQLSNKNSVPWLLTAVMAFAAFFISGRHIYQVVNVSNRFETLEEERASATAYEKLYKRYERNAHPTITNVRGAIDLYAIDRKLSYHVTLGLKNKTNASIDSLHLEWMDFSSMDTLLVGGQPLELLSTDEANRHNIYRLPATLQPNDSLQLEIKGQLHYTGFTNADPQETLVNNGSVITEDILPFIGYDDRRELKENQYRAANGLAKLESRLPAMQDSVAAKKLYASSQAGWVQYQLHISTDSCQSIVGPGLLSSRWREGNRNHFIYQSEHADHYRWHILSARYHQTDTVLKGNSGNVKIEIFSHPGHPYNASHFITAAANAFNYLEPVLGRYPYSTLRIAERPRYGDEIYATTNTIILPEHHGWIADIRRKEDLDYLRFLTAAHIAQHYLQQLPLSRTQGFPLITEGISTYLAYQQLRHFYGDSSLHQHLVKNHEQYLKGRGAERNTEPVLLQADDEASYASKYKGGYVLYLLSTKIGEQKLNDAITAFVKEAAHSEVPVNANVFYRHLRNISGDDHHDFLRRAFETLEVFAPEKQ